MRVGLVCAHAGSSRHVDGPPVGTQEHIARVAAELAARGHDVRVYERRDDPALPATRTSTATGWNGSRSARPTRCATAELVPYVAEFGRWLADAVGRRLDPRGGARALLGRRPGRRARGPRDRHPGGADVPLARRRAAASPRPPLRRAGAAHPAGTGADPGGGHRGRPVQRRGRRADPDGPATQPRWRWCRPGWTPSGSTPTARRRRATSGPGSSPSAGSRAGHGQDDLIRAMRLVGDAELVIAGGPPAEQLAGHAEARRLRELAERAGRGATR